MVLFSFFTISFSLLINNFDFMVDFGSVLIVEQNNDDIYDYFVSQGEIPKLDFIEKYEIESIGGMPEVDFFDYSSDFVIYSSVQTRFFDKSEMNFREKGADFEVFGLRGVYKEEFSDLKFDKIKLVKGRGFRWEELEGGNHVAFVSKEMAIENNLQIGSFLDMESAVFDDSNLINKEDIGMITYESRYYEYLYDSLPYQLEVIGIFENIGSEDFSSVIYVPGLIVEEINNFYFDTISEIDGEEHESFLIFESMFCLKGGSDENGFMKKASVYLPNFYEIKRASL